MNPGGSLPNHENRTIFDGTPPQGFSEARGAEVFFRLFVPDPPRGRPFAGRRRSSYMEACEKNLVSYLNSSIFRKIPSP
jgi:hypothetical protein